MNIPLLVVIETTPKKVFASALEWPGLARAGGTEDEATAALLTALPRYAPVTARAGHPLDPDRVALVVAQRLEGNSTTAFGAPAVIADADRAPSTAEDAARLADLVEAAWQELDAVAATAPEALRKGPRGGGRDRSKILAHVMDAEAAYAQVLGRKHRPVDAAAVAAMRGDLLELLRQPSDGSPVAGRKWPPRYAARRIAWHVLDHAWEIEDRSELD